MKSHCAGYRLFLFIAAGLSVWFPEERAHGGPLDQWTAPVAPPTTRPLYAVSAGTNRLVAVGARVAVTSTDLSVWTAQEVNTNFFGVAYGNQMFFAVGQSGASMALLDGQSTWSPRYSGAVLANANAVAYASGTFVIVGDKGSFAITTDGSFWNWINSGTAEALRAVTSVRSSFVAVGDQGTILLSRDRLPWINRTPLPYENLRGVAYGGGRLVALGDFAGMVVSQDGLNWEPLDSGYTDSMSAVAYGGGTFVAVGQLGAIWSSPDGVQWTTRNSGTEMDLFGIAYFNGRFVAVGDSGTILASGELPAVTLTAENTSVLESQSADPPRLRFTRTGSTEADLAVNLSVSGTALNGVDYAPLADVVVIPAGQTSATIEITPIQDAGSEEVETVVVTLLEGERYGVEPPGNVVVNLGDWRVSLESADAQADEAGLDPGAWLVRREGRAEEALEVYYETGGSATPGADYEALSGTVTIPGGQDSAMISVRPLDDDLSEGQETVRVTLRPASRYLVGTANSGMVSIADDEPEPRINWDVWQWRLPKPAGVPFNKVVFGNNVFVALNRGSGFFFTPARSVGRINPFAGGNGGLFSSFDGRDWTTCNPGLDVVILDIAFARGRFVVATGGGIILTSEDGRSWSPRRVQPDSRAIRLLYGAHELLLGVDSSGELLSSPDGVAWAGVETPIDGYVAGLAYGNGRYVAVSHDAYPASRIWTSDDGDHWSTATNILTRHLHTVAFGGGAFLVTGEAGLAMSSADGQAWSEAHDGPDLPNLAALAYGAGQFAAVAYQEVLTSSQGAAWWQVGIEPYVWLIGIAYGNGVFVAVGGDWNGAHVMSSTDGESWTPHHNTSSQSLRAVAFNGQTLVAAGDNVILSSSNGVDWIEQTNDPSFYVRGVAHGHNQFVAVGNQILTSPDGILWTERASPMSLHSVAWGQDRFVAVGDYGAVETSWDGEVWNPQDSGVLWSLGGVAWGNGLYVAVSPERPSEVLTSMDGVQWHPQGQLAESPFYDVAFVKDFFVALGGQTDFFCCGDSRSILTSLDGTNWVVRSGGGLYRGMAASNTGTLVAVGGGSEFWGHGETLYRYLASSEDGARWTPRTPPFTRRWLNKVVWAYSSFFAVGENGAILQSRPAPSMPQPRFVPGGIARLADGLVRVELEAPVGSVVILEASQDMQFWSFVDGAQCVDGTVRIEDPEGSLAPTRFYRARAPIP